MRVFLPATLAAFVAAGATFALAQAPAPSAPGNDSRNDPRMERRMERMEKRGARMEQRFGERIQKLKTELKLTPAQEPLFGAVEQQLRKMATDRSSERQSNRDRMRNAELPDRLDMMSQRAAKNATGMSELSGIVKPLWATLSAEQKDIVKKSLPGRGHWGNREGRGDVKGERKG